MIPKRMGLVNFMSKSAVKNQSGQLALKTTKGRATDATRFIYNLDGSFLKSSPKAGCGFCYYPE